MGTRVHFEKGPNGRRIVGPYERPAAEVAADVERAARQAREAAREGRLREIYQKMKAGTDTAADRNRALKLAVGILLAIAAEDNE